MVIHIVVLPLFKAFYRQKKYGNHARLLVILPLRFESNILSCTDLERSGKNTPFCLYKRVMFIQFYYLNMGVMYCPYALRKFVCLQ